MDKPIGVWDVVKHSKYGEGQVVGIAEPYATVYFRDAARSIMQSHLRFLRQGNPKEFLPPKKPGSPATAGRRRHLPEEGKARLESHIAEGMKLSPLLTKAFKGLVNDLRAEIGNDWFSRHGGFCGQVSSKKTGNMRNCFEVNLHLSGYQVIYDDADGAENPTGKFLTDNSRIHIFICHADTLPEKHRAKFVSKPKDYYGHAAYLAKVGRKEIPKLKDYRTALFDTIKFARHGHL